MSDFWRGVVRWDNEDVMMAAFDEDIIMSIDDANEWWNKHEREFKTMLTEYGNQIIRSILEEENNHGNVLE